MYVCYICTSPQDFFCDYGGCVRGVEPLGVPILPATPYTPAVRITPRSFGGFTVGLSNAQWEVLWVLADSPGLDARQIAQRCRNRDQVAPNSVRATALALVGRGLATTVLLTGPGVVGQKRRTWTLTAAGEELASSQAAVEVAPPAVFPHCPRSWME